MEAGLSLCRSRPGALSRPHLHQIDRGRSGRRARWPKGRRRRVGQDGAREGKGFFCISRAQRWLLPREPPGDRRRGGVVEGDLKKPPEGPKQSVDLRVEKVIEVGPVDPAKYPLPKMRLTLEFLRDFVHLRARSNTISAIARIRDELAYATHAFFRKNGFRCIHIPTPIITTSDCGGAGEMFQVTTLFSDAEKLEKELQKYPPPSESDVEAAKLIVKEKGEVVSLLKASKASKYELVASIAEINEAKENVSKLEEIFNLKPGLPQKDGKIDYARYFFGHQAFITVSEQLQVETYACALGNVYTFVPTFRAEHSHTSRYLPEFGWLSRR